MNRISHRNGEEYQSIFENATEGIFQSSIEGIYLRVNPAMARIFGYDSPKDMIECVKDIAKHIHVDEESRKQFIEVLTAQEHVEGFEARNYRKDRSIIWTRTNARTVRDGEGNILYFEGFLTDITARKEAEIALLENEEKYRQLFEAESDAIFLIDNKSGNILEVNDAATVLYGYSKEEVLQKKNSDLSAEPEETRQVTQTTPVVKDRVVTIPLRYHRKKDGTVFPVEITGRFFEWRGHPVHIAAIRDITERRRVEEALRESEQNFRNIVEHTTNIYYSHTPEHVLTFMSPQTREILGYEPEEVLINWQELLTDNPVNQEGIELTQKAIDTGKRQRTYELELKRKDGRSVWVEVHESPVLQDGKTIAIVGALTDITERKRAETIFNHQLEELTILHNIAVAASSSKTLDELIKRATDTVYESLHPDNCGVELVTDDGKAYQTHPSYRGISPDGKRKPMPLSEGITGKVITAGIPVRIGDVSQDQHYIEATKGIRSELCVPIKIQERIIGAFNIESRQANAYSASDERLLNTVAGTLATAIEQLRLFETSQRRLKELAILNKVTQASNDATSVDRLIEVVTQIIGESLYPDNFGVLLLNAEGMSLTPHPSYRGISVGKFPTNFSLTKGVCGQVAASGKPLRIANVRNHKNYIEVTSQVRSELCVPIAHGDHILGVINAESLIINMFTEDDERLMITIASTLATAIEKLRLLEAEKRRRQEAETLLDATTTLTTSLNMDILLDIILEILSGIVPSDSASIALKQNGMLVLVAGRGFPPEYDVVGKRLSLSEKWLLLSRTQKPSIVQDVQQDPVFEQWEGSEYIRGWMGVPLVVHGQLKGLINLDSRKPDSFTENHAILAQTFANSAAVAIENARLFEIEQQNRQKAEALREATADLTAFIELESLYQTILESLSKLVPFDSASIEIVNQGMIQVVAGKGLKANITAVGQQYPYDAAKWGELVELRNPIIIYDAQEDERFEKFEGTDYIHGWMGVPLFVQDKLVGFLNLDSSTKGFFTQDHASLAQTFGNQAAIAIENARLFQEESRRSQIIEAMANIANEFSTAHELTPALDKITQLALSLLNASTVAIYLLQDDNKTIGVVTAQGTYREQLMSHTIQIGTGITGNIIATGKPEIVDNLSEDSRRVTVPGTPEEDAQRDTMMSAPLILRGKTIGAINAWRKRSSDLFNESELNFLVSIAHQTSMTIESIRLLQETVRRAQEAHAIAEVGRGISSTLQLDIVLERIAQYAKDLLKAETSAVYLANVDDSQLRAIAAIGIEAQEIKNFPLRIGSGILGNIALQKSGEIVNHTLNDSRAITVEGTETDPNEHLMGVPVLSKNQLTGLLAVWRTGDGEDFKPFELDFLSSLAQQAAVAIENARLFEAEQRHFQEAEALRQATAALNAFMELEPLYQTILEWLSKLVPFDSASIEILDQKTIKVVAGKGFKDNNRCIGQQYPYEPEKWEKLLALREPIIISDVQEDDRFVKFEGENYIRGWMGVPMFVQDKLVGFLNLDSSTKGFFTQDHAALAQTFGNQAAIAIENVLLFESEQKRRREAEILRQASAALTSSLEPNEVLNALLDQIETLIPFNSVAVFLQENDHYKVVAGKGFKHPEKVIGKNFPFEDKLASIVRDTGKAIVSYDIQKDPRFQSWGDADGIHGWMCFPLKVRGQVIGHLTIDSYEVGAYSESDAELAMAFANQAATALENARLFEAEQRRHRESETLRQAAVAISTSLELESILETILIVMKPVLPYDSASILLLEGEELCLTAAHGFSNSSEILGLKFPADDELFTTARRSAEPVIIKNAQNDKRFKQWAGTNYVRGWMGVPLLLRNEVIGYITFDNRKEDFYNESHAALAQAFADQTAFAIQNARQFEAEQRHFQEAETLRQAAEAITSTLDIERVLDSILDHLNRAIPFDSASVFLIEDDQVRLTACKGISVYGTMTDLLFPAGNALFQEIWQTGQALILKDAQSDPRFEKWVVDHTRGWLGIPLTARGNIIGYITIDSKKVAAYNERDANLAMTFAHQAAVAIENARLYERGEQQIRKLTVLRDIDSAISSSFDLRITLNLLISYAIRELNADAGAILLYNSDLKSLYLYTSAGFNNKQANIASHIRIGEGLAGHVVLQRKLIQIDNLASTTEFQPAPYTIGEGFKSYFGVPLISKGQIKGVMEIFTRELNHPDPDWLNFLQTLAGQAAIAIDNVQMFRNLQRSNQELILAYDTTLAGWGRALELRDKETQGHTDRVVELTLELARRMGVEGEELTHIMRGTLLHDIGKMGIPDHILHKPGPLSEEEWVIMRQHPQYAYDLMNPIPYLRQSLDIPYAHHERWDGSGYPRGLKGEEIPLAARIFAVVDIWDALLYERVYRDAWPEDKVIEYLKNTAGIELDPAIVEKFLELIEELRYENQAE